MRGILTLPWIIILLMTMAGRADAPSSRTTTPEADDVYIVRVAPRATDAVLNNPFMGLVPGASYDDFPVPHSMVYKVLTWRELEPEKGAFAFETIERRYGMDAYAAREIRFVLRVALDYGTDERHMDIPDWLYEEIDGDGIWYDEDVGKGFSPNYANATLQRYHERLIQALGDRYDADPRVAFVALGSLGHWGEWHTYSDDATRIPFPPMAESDRYVAHYLEAFPNKKLLMRRPYPIAERNGIGLYNDVFGGVRQTYDFIDWFENGYASALADAFVPATPDFWKRGPSGGEFGNAGMDGMYFDPSRFAQLLDMARRSHLSWVGPSTDIEELDEAERRNLDRFLNTIGYRFAVRAASYPVEWRPGEDVTVGLEVRNLGVAPFYYDWPLELALVDAAGRIVFREAADETDIRGWMPGETVFEERLRLPASLPEGVYTLTIAIVDPATGAPGVDWAMEGRRPDGRYALGPAAVAAADE
ncbi:DUF4832 domain-containing protein [Paenibacillus antri]|uniref:DUF4832 domain-containing protein n=1 Tax=Paenibacillus antri TaxID=2582848 RepID=A0A5R9G5A9_9BACL|nr:DUF4832 domain-containing protein [Paenibacillus antri]TLS48678.1 DUF4832 domain-containing protein [Paenibacillus antri]